MIPSRGGKQTAFATKAPEARSLFKLSRQRFQNFFADDDREGEP